MRNVLFGKWVLPTAVVLFCWGIALLAREGSGPTCQPTSFSQIQPQDILVRSRLLAQQLTIEERVIFLSRLADTAAAMDSANARTWSKELFDLAQQLPPSWNRIAAEKNAVRSLSRIDPVKAFTLFRRIDLPVEQDNGLIPEDVRADAAREVFAGVWRVKGQRYLKSLRREALRLADTGEYPYMAMAPILSDVAKDRAALAGDMFDEALGAFQRGTSVLSANADFADFVLQTHTSVTPDRFSAALRVLVSHLLGEHKEQRKYTSRVTTGKGTAELHSEEDAILFRLFPLIKQVDESLARSVMEQRPDVARNEAINGVVERSETHVVEDDSRLGASVSSNDSLELSRLYHLEAVAETDPDAALKLARTISDPAIRAIALSNVASAYSKTAPNKAQSLLDEVQRHAQPSGGTREQSAALASMARVAAEVCDLNLAREKFGAAFELEADSIQNYSDLHPSEPTMFAEGFEDLAKLVQLGMKIDPQQTLEDIGQLHNETLAAYLLIDAAKGAWTVQKVSTQTPILHLSK